MGSWDSKVFPACWILIGQFKFQARQPYASWLFHTWALWVDRQLISVGQPWQGQRCKGNVGYSGAPKARARSTIVKKIWLPKGNPSMREIFYLSYDVIDRMFVRHPSMYANVTSITLACSIHIDYYMLRAWYRFYSRVFNTISRTNEPSSEWTIWY